MVRHSSILVFLFVSTLVAEDRSAIAVDFSHEIVPILRSNCVTCHGGREAEGGFSINSRQELIESEMVLVGKSSDSHLLSLLQSDDVEVQMPPPDRPRLSESQVQLIRAWIDEGVPWEPGFSFAIQAYEPPLRPREVTLPPSRGGREHPIDRVLDQYLFENGLPSTARIGDAAFLRRASLDLVGLLPTESQRTKYFDDPPGKRRERLIDRLLSRQLDYADHWLTFFNDLFRNDYSGTGFITGGRKQISGWLYSSLVNNMPFDQMARELVSPENGESSGFIDGIKWRGTVSAGQTLEIQFAQSVSQSFLGINMKCASCHDSFIDRWTLKDAYGLAAIYAEQPLDLYRCDKPTGESQAATWLFPELGKISADANRKQRLDQLANLMTDPQNGRFARTIVNRLWHRLMGRGIVHPLDAMQTEPWNQDLLDVLANHLVETGYDLKSTLRLIATSHAYQSQTAIVNDPENGNFIYRGPLARRMTAEQFLDAVWQITGAAPASFEAPVFRSKLSAEEVAKTQVQGQWIWRPIEERQVAGGDEVLLRKIVDLSSDVVGGGAVVTCDNRYTLYVRNREVTSGNDWTKPQRVSLQGKVKKGKNLIVIKARNDGATDSVNPAGLFFQAHLKLADGSKVDIVSDGSWQSNRNIPASREGRMTAPKTGWSSVVVQTAVAPWTTMLENHGKVLIAQIGSDESDQSMVRAALMKNTPLMQSLGRPLREQIVSMRPNGLSTLEAIDLANNESLANALSRGAERWHARLSQQIDPATPVGPKQRNERWVEALFQDVLTRSPTDQERELLLRQWGDQPSVQQVEDTLWALFMLPEFMFVR